MNYYVLALMSPVVGLLLMLLSMRYFKIATQIFLSFSIGGFLIDLFALLNDTTDDLKIAYIFASFILFVSFNVQKFSLRYMSGESHFMRYFMVLAALTVSTHSMVLSVDFWGFWLCWTLNGFLLVILMAHQFRWKASKYSAMLTLLFLMMGSVCLAVAFVFSQQIFAKWFLVLAAMCQSAIWPFHRWLLSSLNSPTPVSALMHAGVINGGGILLVKYHHVFSQDLWLMQFIFVMGLISAILGGSWKLIQVDIKKMLANSTMAQMGFMMMQCGMGLFPAAVAHLCWHGLFKAYLFLSAGSALQSRFMAEPLNCDIKHRFGVALSTLLALGLLIQTAGLDLSTMNTHWLLLCIMAITLWQLSSGLVGKNHMILDIVLVSLFAGLYGLSLRLLESFFGDGSSSLSLHPLFVLGFILLFGLWLFKNSSMWTRIKNSPWGLKTYVWALNASQPYTKTVTAIRQTYQR